MPTRKARAAKAAKKTTKAAKQPAKRPVSAKAAPKADGASQVAKSAHPAHFVFAGDFNVQSIRYETKSAFPVHRYGFSFDVHRHKCLSGPFLLKHLVEQCFEYLEITKLDFDNQVPETTAQPDPAAANRLMICTKLKQAQTNRAAAMKSRVWQREKTEEHLPDSPPPISPSTISPPKTVPLTTYHESVAIIRDSGIRETAGNPPSDCLIAPRIYDSHSISHSQPDPERYTIDERTLGDSSLNTPDIVLSLDLKNFGTTANDFNSLSNALRDAKGGTDGPAGSANVITRMVVPRAVVNQPRPKSKLDEFIKSYGSFLSKHRKNRDREAKPQNGKSNDPGTNTAEGVSVLVIGSESLRNAGLDISYRVTWERTISSIVREIREMAGLRQAESSGNRTYSKREESLLSLVAMHDYVVVCFYNDGALIVPTKSTSPSDKFPDGDAILIAAPSQIEGDHWYRFCGTMKGTGSLVTAAIAFHLRCQTGEESDLDTDQRIRKATILGLKSSRYLQSHGYITLHRCAYQVLEGLPVAEKPPKERAYSKMVEKLGSSNLDIIRYFWNRTRSIVFARDGLVPHAVATLNPGSDEDTKICIWPLGDLVEILSSGHPTFGSFPPVGLKLEEGREAIDRETRKVLEAWNDCGWLEVGCFKWSDVAPSLDSKKLAASGYPYWSLRSVGVKRLAAALRASLPHGAGMPEERHRIVARFLLAELLVRFGTKRVNRDGMEAKCQFDYELVKRAIQYGVGELAAPRFYNGYFDGMDPAKFVSSLTSVKAAGRKSRKYSQFSKFEEENKHLLWLRNPTHGSLLGVFPEFSLRRLHTIDSRDTQSYRDIRERLLNFKGSKEIKPLNLLVLGSPGSGKSFGVKQIIEGVFGPKDVVFLEYNVASFSGNKESLTSAFLEIQNAALGRKLPVVFWDEFDTTVDDVKLSWLGAFLGPMQDGSFLIDQSSRNLPKCVFVFAGSVFSKFEQVRMLDALQGGRPTRRGTADRHPSGFATTSGWSLTAHDAATAEPDYQFTREGDERLTVTLPATDKEWRKAKGRDFKSRITGVLDIASVDPRTEEEVVFGLPEDDDAWLFRRAAAVRQSFETHAGHLLYRGKELQISENTLFSFLTFDCFDHGYRSIENLVRMSSLHERAIADGSVVPTDAQVRIHCRTDLFGPGNTSAYDSDSIARMFTYR